MKEIIYNCYFEIRCTASRWGEYWWSCRHKYTRIKTIGWNQSTWLKSTSIFCCASANSTCVSAATSAYSESRFIIERCCLKYIWRVISKLYKLGGFAARSDRRERTHTGWTRFLVETMTLRELRVVVIATCPIRLLQLLIFFIPYTCILKRRARWKRTKELKRELNTWVRNACATQYKNEVVIDKTG